MICALLNLCHDDEDAEEEVYAELSGVREGKKRRRDGDGEDREGGDGEADARRSGRKKGPSGQKREAAKYRVRTELESYPATRWQTDLNG